jgi:hypothetical protein
MTMNFHRWFRTDGKRSNAGRRTGSHGVSRRLILERIEDRLLLSAGFQTAIETQLHNAGMTAADCEIAFYTSDNVSYAVVFNRNLSGAVSSAAHPIDFTVLTTPAAVAAAIAALPPVCFAWIPITEHDLPGVTPVKGILDVAPVAARAIYATLGPVLPDASTTAQGQPPATVKSTSAPTGVEGESGRCQVFELAAAGAWTSKPNEQPLPAGSAGADRREVASAATQSDADAKDLLLSGLSQNASRWRQSPEKPVGDPAAVPAASVAPAQAVENAQPLSAQVKPRQPHTLTSSELPPTTELIASPVAGQTVPLLARATDPADVVRKAIFAEIAENPEEHWTVPAYFLDNRRTSLISLAIVSLAGPRLTQKWWRRADPCPTCQQPPRRRDSAV